jgi:hypothetical protein
MRLYYENIFRDTYEAVFGVRPVFSVAHLTGVELIERATLIANAQRDRLFGS